jgi:starvation-inducible DNA-binding protein
MDMRSSSAPLIATHSERLENAPGVAETLNALLADIFALYLKTKSFHWHITGPQFRDYHLLLDEQAAEIFAMTDVVAERVRKIGAKTLRSVGDIQRFQRLRDNDEDYVDPPAMLVELLRDNRQLAGEMREAHRLCEDKRDIATASILETYVDETERRAWFLREISSDPPIAL